MKHSLTILILVLAAVLMTNGAAKPVTAVHIESQDAKSVVAAFERALDSHDAAAALALFTDDAVVRILPEDVLGGVIASGKDQIRRWLEGATLNQIQVQALSEYQVSGNNVTWTESFRIYQYEDINALATSGVVGKAEAVVQGNRIKSFTLTFSPDSVTKLRALPLSSKRASLASSTFGFLAGLAVLSLILPAGAIYYITRVKSLFASVPRLERPWLLLEAGVASLFIALLLVSVRNTVGFSSQSLDTIQYLVVVLTGAFILAAMVLMKRVWTIPSGE